jgi:hypothetical protein
MHTGLLVVSQGGLLSSHNEIFLGRKVQLARHKPRGMFSLLSDYLRAFSFLVVSQGGLPALSMYCIPDTGDQMSL